MENTMGNDMDSTNPITGFSFINDSLFIDDSSLVFDAFFRTYLLLAEAGSKVFDFLTSAAVAACPELQAHCLVCEHPIQHACILSALLVARKKISPHTGGLDLDNQIPLLFDYSLRLAPSIPGLP